MATSPQFKHPLGLDYERMVYKRYNSECKITNTYSHIWKDIHHDIQTLKLGLAIRIGNGQRTSLWNDPWVKGVPLNQSLHHAIHEEDKLKVTNVTRDNGL